MSVPSRHRLAAGLRGLARPALIGTLALSCVDLGAPVPDQYEAIDVGRLLGCHDDRACWSRASDINRNGLVVGDGLVPSTGQTTHAYEQVAFAVAEDALTLLWTDALGRLDAPLALNDAGTAVGLTTAGEPPTAPYHIGVLWEHGTTTLLDFWPSDLNEAGDIVGSDGYRVAVLWRDGALIELGTLAGLDTVPRFRVSGALGINDVGVVVGWSETADFATRAFVWEDGTMTELPSLDGNSFAAAVNDAGTIVGWSMAADGNYHAVRWDDGAITDLGTLGGGESFANGINERGEIVGGSKTAAGDYHAVLWRAGSATDLGTLPGFASSHAYRINESGDIVGYSAFPKAMRATVWRVRAP